LLFPLRGANSTPMTAQSSSGCYVHRKKKEHKTRRSFALLILISLISGCLQTEKEFILLHNTNVITMLDEEILTHHSIAIQGRTIVEIGPAIEMREKYNSIAQIINLRNRYVMPGLTDLHIHTNFYWDSGYLNVHPVDLMLQNGITTIREGEHYNSSIHDFINTPEIQKINYIPTVIDRSPDIESEIQIIPYLKIKYTTELNSEYLSQGLYQWGHISQFTSINDARRLSEIAHIREITKVGLENIEDIILENGIIIHTTMIALQEIMDRYQFGLASYTEEELSYLNDDFIDFVTHDFYDSPRNFLHSDEDFQNQIQLFEQDRDILLQLHRAGVQLLSCTDSGSYWSGGIPGRNLHEEFQILSNIGLSNFEVLKTNLVTAYEVSRRMNLSENFGVLAPNTRADLLILKKNPFEDLENLHQMDRIMVAGNWSLE
jgi:histidinol phosphatase-like PHP family hydrolase